MASALLGAACVVSGDPFVVEEDRKAAGMKPIEEVRAAGGEDPEVAKHVDKRRKKFGLPPLAETKSLKVRFRVKAEIV